MRLLETRLLALAIIIPLFFSACSDNDNKEEIPPPCLTTIYLLTSTLIEEDGGYFYGVTFGYNEKYKLEYAYNYIIDGASDGDTTFVKKYTFDRSTDGIIIAKEYYEDNKNKGEQWIENGRSKKIYGDYKITKIESYSHDFLMETQNIDWDNSIRITRISSGGVGIDSVEYDGFGNYIDYAEKVSTFTFPKGYQINTIKTVSSFDSDQYSRSARSVPIEYALIADNQKTYFPLNEYFSANELDQTVETKTREFFEIDKTTRKYTIVETITKDYTIIPDYTGDIVNISIKTAINTKAMTENFQDPSKNSESSLFENKTKRFTQKIITF